MTNIIEQITLAHKLIAAAIKTKQTTGLKLHTDDVFEGLFLRK